MENAINIQLPLSVSYPAVEEVLKKQMVGEAIPRTEEGVDAQPYAQILDIRIEGNSTGGNEVILYIQLRILRTLLKRDRVDLLVRATLGYDNSAQQLFVRKFKLDSRTSSGFFNTSLEVLANKVAYTQILKKARFNVRALISKELLKANGMLESGLELKGVKLMGKVEQLCIQDVAAQPDRLSLQLDLQGNLTADIFDLLSLMRP